MKRTKNNNHPNSFMARTNVGNVQSIHSQPYSRNIAGVERNCEPPAGGLNAGGYEKVYNAVGKKSASQLKSQAPAYDSMKRNNY